MILRSSTFLGIAVGDRTIGCAEVSSSAGRRAVRKAATLTLPAGVTLDTPEAVGAALKAFLRENGFSSARAVVGVPAKWLIARENEVPPADREQVRSMLALAAERLSAAESSELVFDYAGQIDASPAGPRRVLLVAMLKNRLDQLERAMEFAGVSVAAVTSTALALAETARHAGQDLPMLMLGRQGAEMVLHHAGTPRMLRHLSVVAQNGHGVATGPLGSELRRAVALAPAVANGSGGSNGGSRELLLWDAVGLSNEQLDELSDRTGVRLRSDDDLKALGIQGPAPAGIGDVAIGQYAPAVSLALAAADRALLPLNFKQSRLAPKKKKQIGRRTVWGAAAAVLIVASLVALYVHVEKRERDLAVLQKQLTEHKLEWDEARAFRERFDYGMGFFEKRSPMLECLREITLAFRENEPIWVMNFRIGEDKDQRKGVYVRKGQLQGKANNQETVGAVLERLKQNPKFADIKLDYAQEAGGRSREVAFSITFTYTSAE